MHSTKEEQRGRERDSSGKERGTRALEYQLRVSIECSGAQTQHPMACHHITLVGFNNRGLFGLFRWFQLQPTGFNMQFTNWAEASAALREMMSTYIGLDTRKCCIRSNISTATEQCNLVKIERVASSFANSAHIIIAVRKLDTFRRSAVWQQCLIHCCSPHRHSACMCLGTCEISLRNSKKCFVTQRKKAWLHRHKNNDPCAHFPHAICWKWHSVDSHNGMPSHHIGSSTMYCSWLRFDSLTIHVIASRSSVAQFNSCHKQWTEY